MGKPAQGPSVSHPKEPSRSLLWLSIMVTTLGTCGVGNGINGLQDQPFGQGQVVPAAEDPTSEEAVQATQQALADALNAMPHRRALAAANIVVSVLLFIAGIRLLSRRKSALWWTSQATVANGLWTLWEGAAQVLQIHASQTRLAEVFNAQIEAQMQEQPGAGQSISGHQLVWLYVGIFIVYALLRVAMYAWLAWVVRRSTIANALTHS